jgi:uncharacterized protein Usg
MSKVSLRLLEEQTYRRFSLFTKKYIVNFRIFELREMQKTFLRVVLFAVFFLALLIAEINFNVTKAEDYGSSGTSVGGVISQDTTWTLENSPYIFIDDVTVAGGVTLTIEPGVIVDLDFWSLRVDGTLYAVGNETHRIKLQAHERPLSGNIRIYLSESSVNCIIEYAEIDLYGGGGYGIRGGHPTIKRNIMRFSGCDAGIVATGGIISNNTIVVNAYRGIVAYGSASILDNIIAGGSYSDVAIGAGGLKDDFPGEHTPTIVGNLIINFRSNVGRAAITFYGGKPYVANNTILKSIRAISFPSYFDSSEIREAKIIFNNIYGSVEVGKSDPRITINLTYNWWGTTNTTLIDNRIWDQKDDRSLCLINYTPFLTAPAVAPANLTYPICITTLTQEPEDKVEPYQEVKIKANVTDEVVGVGEVMLQYSVDGGLTWNFSSIIYNETSRLYEGIIPGQPENTVVQYIVIASDKFHNYYAYWPDQGAFTQPPVYCVYTVIPEFPSTAFLLIFLALLTMPITITVKKHRRHSN